MPNISMFLWSYDLDVDDVVTSYISNCFPKCTLNELKKCTIHIAMLRCPTCEFSDQHCL